jgi:hypothetical protein
MNSIQRNRQEPRPDPEGVTQEELRLIRLELSAIRKIIDAFAGTYLNSRFPFGKATDRWFRR